MEDERKKSAKNAGFVERETSGFINAAPLIIIWNPIMATAFITIVST